MKFGKLFLCTLAAASLFVGCKEKEDFGEPNIKVDPETLEFGSAKESQTIALTATRDWKANDIPSWLTVVPSSGGASSKPQTVTVSVEENKEYDIEGKVTFSIGTFTASLTVKQKGAKGDPSSSMVYYNDFDKEAATQTYGTSGSSWPYLDQFDGWKNQKGSGVENVSYESSGASARTNSAPKPEYGFSGTNNIMISKSAGSYFRVNEISLPAESVNYQLSFGCWKYSGANISNEYFKVYISNDAVKWVELKWTVADVAEDQWWKPVSYNFTLPANTSKLYMYFTGNDSSNDVRIEDLKLIESETAGENIDFSQGIELGGGTQTDPAGPQNGDGSKENPFNVAAAFAKIKTLEADVNSEEFYITGKIASVQEVSTQYGNATYYIEDEGYEGSLMVYRGYYVNGEKFTSADQIKVGDNVLILGKLVNFKGNTPEVAQGNKIVALNGAEPKEFSVSTTTASVGADVESYIIKISGNVSWTAEITESADVEAKIQSGANGEGDGEVVLQLSKNTTDAERVTKVTVSTEEEVAQKSFVVILTQKAQNTEPEPSGETVVLNIETITSGIFELLGGQYGDSKDKEVAGEIGSIGFKVMNIAYNNNASPEGFAAKQFIQIKKNTGYIASTTEKTIKSLKVWASEDNVTINIGDSEDPTDIASVSTTIEKETLKDYVKGQESKDIEADIIVYNVDVSSNPKFFKISGDEGAMYIRKIEIIY